MPATARLPGDTLLGPVRGGLRDAAHGRLGPLATGRLDTADALALAQLVRDAVAAEVPRQVLHLRLSRLAGRMRRDHHRRLLREALEPALRPLRSRLFELPNGDLLAVAPPDGRHLRDAEATLRLLLASRDGEPPPEPLHAMWELPRDAAVLLAAIEDSLGPPPAPQALPPTPADFTADDLAALEGALRSASLAPFLRRRPVCRLSRGAQGAELAWEEWGVAWPDLRLALRPDADPAAAPWLCRRLRRLLDRRLLAELARPEEARARGPMGLRLAAPTLAETEFLRLDSMLDAGARAGTVLALAAEDALADAEGFAFARDFARVRGYRLALDLPGPDLLPLLPLDRLDMDLLRLPWSPDLAGLAASLPADPRRVVLAAADQAAAIGWGWEAGITLFEGRFMRSPG